MSEQTTTTVNYLAPILGEICTKVLTEDGKYRRYRVDSFTSTSLRGNTDMALKAASYYIGRCGAQGSGLNRHGESTNAMSTAIRVSDYAAADFAGSARRYANFSGDFSVMDLAGMAERLAAGIAHYSVHGTLNPSLLRGGGAVSVIAIGATTAPVAASTGHVWIPRCADAVTAPNTFCALLNAASGEGATVVTDLLQVDNDNVPVVPSAEGAELAEGCYHALRLIGGNYEVAGAGDIFAYAVVRGVHKAVTVAAHTAEGGWFRTALRAGRFATPFGGLNTRHWEYIGLPRALSTAAQTYAGLTDSIALASAAAVAACDPLVTIGGVRLPTVMAASGAGLDEPGMQEEPVPNRGASLASQLAHQSGEFCRLYSRACSRIMAIKGESGLACQHLLACIRLADLANDRHLQNNVIAPYFWVEPTGLCTLSKQEFPAVAEGYAQLAEVGHDSEMPLLPDAYDVKAAGPRVRATFSWASARKVGLLLHLNQHPENGLSHMRLRAADAGAWALLGSAGESVASRLQAGRTTNSMLWTRGDSLIIAPSEAIYTKRWVTAEFLTHSWDEDSGDTTLLHMPTASELANGHVRVTTTRAIPWGVGPLRGDPRDVSRVRTRAVQALARAHAIAGADFDDGFVEVSFTAPAGPQDRGVSLVGPTGGTPATAKGAGDVSDTQRATESGPATGGSHTGPSIPAKAEEGEIGGTRSREESSVVQAKESLTTARGTPLKREVEASLIRTSRPVGATGEVPRTGEQHPTKPLSGAFGTSAPEGQ